MKKKYLALLSKHIFIFFLISSLAVLPPIANYMLSRAYAGVLTSSKVTISDSRSSITGITHEFVFTTATTGTITHVDFEYCASSTGVCVAPTGLVLGTTVGSVTGLGAGTGGVASNIATYTVTAPASVSNGTTITVPWTDVDNPTTADTSFFVNVKTYIAGPTVLDTSQVASAVLTDTSISVSASIGSVFVFTVEGIDFSADTSGIGNVVGEVNGETLNVTTTANTIPFGTMSDATPKVAAHDVSVTTNATNGFVVTTRTLADPPLVDGGNNIDPFTGTNGTPTVWSSPAGGTANINTGFFGYTTEDAVLGTGTVDRFTNVGNEWAGFTTSPAEVIYMATAPAGGTEAVRVGWQAEINGLQPAGTYAGTVILVATPTY
mgnify:FL=1